MDEPAWWPSGIALSSIDESVSEGTVRTSFGKTTVWDFEPYLQPSHWNSSLEIGVQWGDWNFEVQTVEVQSVTKNGLVVTLNDAYTASILPFGVGDDVSRLYRYEPWNSALVGHSVLLPIAGWTVDGNDRILVFPRYELKPFDGQTSTVMDLTRTIGGIHSALVGFSTPNTERRWNDRLKAIEDELKTKTMWRAPHANTTVGLPRLHLSIDSLTEVDGVLNFVPMSRSLAEHLLCENDRLPSLATLMMLEHQWARRDGLSEQQRQQLLETWGASVPVDWSSRTALSTVRGGAWVWRYHATLLELAQATAFAEASIKEDCQKWLRDVSRLQAHLGTLRMWKSGQWVGFTGLAVAFFSYRLDSFLPQQSLALAVLSFGVVVASNAVYRLKDPKAY
ncbi:MAG: hypothetical protein HON05_05760 [Euryarchaeota archaeon]|jgi:hypothetical protein|nr:hypothetical protein [Euryarchaeota archaeon]MBT5026246.1 hypothetical protein [Euryarchaeota archaeon]MBT5453729.1 hypothetical protein [Euryarchaeota archaeon]MBT6527478.1 hypothetical protein [Euryarchaeota archaeon]MBT7961609.1 hypothetical protein [Euryarchaeota archaeon]